MDRGEEEECEEEGEGALTRADTSPEGISSPSRGVPLRGPSTIPKRPILLEQWPIIRPYGDR
jgi:hypothetical protein